MFRIVQLQKKERMNQSTKDVHSTQTREYSSVSLLQRDGQFRLILDTTGIGHHWYLVSILGITEVDLRNRIKHH